MITTQVRDIFETPISFAIAHQANCQNTMGSGIAALIAKNYPEAQEADAKTKKGDHSKLGTLSTAKGADGRLIINAYSQFEIGGEKPTNYEAVHRVFTDIRDRLNKRNAAASNQGQPRLDLALPYGYGSMRGGASWRVINMMIQVIFETAMFDVLICRLPDQADLP